MSVSTSGYKANAHLDSAVVSDGDSRIHSDDSTHEIEPPKEDCRALIRRLSSLFSLLSLDLLIKENLPSPDATEYVAFYDDQRHFNMIRNLHMADFITLLNGFSGFYLIVLCMRFCLTGQLHYLQRAHFFIALGLFFDFFDGRVARLRNKSSLMGQELDSLADLVSFGVSPAVIAFSIGFRSTVDVLALTFWFLCGLTRLARFNISTNKIPKDKLGKLQYFEGLPIPSNLIWIGTMAFLVFKEKIGSELPLGVWNEGAVLEFHPFIIFFLLQGCGEISKSLHIPKP